MGMLSRNKVLEALENKRDRFEEYQASQRDESELRQQRLAHFVSMSAAEVAERLVASGQEWPGAWPTEELDRASQLCIPFAQRWSSYPPARSWALAVLAGRPVAAVDGSQIPPSKELSVPVGAIQIGWFLNYHLPGGRYEKDVFFAVLPPQELGEEEGGEFPDWRVNQERFVCECRQLEELMEHLAAQGSPQSTLCLFDGSFIVSFAGQLRPGRAGAYLDAVQRLLDRSHALRTPLVGFVDSSGSRDCVMLVNTVAGPPHMRLTDGAFLGPLLPRWGDRTPFFVCARNDPLSQRGQANFYRQVAFCYIRLAMERPPARLELPLWLLESGQAEATVDLVRAECIAGAGGYPYALETADAVAVLQQADRDQFYALFQQFVEEQGLPFTLSRKQLSKLARR